MPQKHMWTPISVQSTALDTGGAYLSGDVLDAEMQFKLGEISGKPTAGTIGQALITDAGNVTGAIDLFLFKAASTPAAVNAANAWSDANWRNLVGVIPLATAYDSANNNAVFWMPSNDGLVYSLPTDILYVVPVTRSGHNQFAAVTDLEVTLWIRSDRS